MGKIVAIVQARLGSSRLPGKSLLNLRGTPVIDWVVRRLGQSRLLDNIVVAIPHTPLDRALRDHLLSQDIPCVLGSENDVLGRFLQAAAQTEATTVVRVCADNPFVSAQAVDQLIDFYRSAPCDYAWNHIPRRNLWPDGFGAEIVSHDLLRHLGEVAVEPAQREHCFNYLWDNEEKFNLRTFDPEEKWLQRPEVKLDMDTIDDYGRLARLPVSPESSMNEILRAWDGL